MTAAAVRHLHASLASLAEATAAIVDSFIPDCEGACLGTSAILAVAFAEHDITTTAVRGTFDEWDHWWLETKTHRIDATRRQFDTGPLVQAFTDDGDEVPYLRERSFPSGWNQDQAVEEFACMHTFYDIGTECGRRVLDAVLVEARVIFTGWEPEALAALHRNRDQ